MSYKLFEWNNNYNIGSEIINQQHQQLFVLVNKVLNLALSKDEIDQNEYKFIYNQLLEYSFYHFNVEEKYMEDNGLDSEYILMHKRIHHQFVIYLQEQRKKEVTFKDIFDLVDYYVRWIVQHVLEIDKCIVSQIEFINQGKSSKEAYAQAKTQKREIVEPLLSIIKVLYNVLLEKSIEIQNINKELELKVALRTNELQELNSMLQELNQHDTLTKLHNRHYVMLKLDELILNWQRYDQPFSLLFIDIDKFKLVNDIYGHEAGDKILIWTANLLKSTVRDVDIACRIGGDEFVIICPHTTIDQAIHVGNRINEAVSQKKFMEYQKWIPSLSIGVTQINNNKQNSNDLLKEADQAMYIAKNSGGNKTNRI